MLARGIRRSPIPLEVPTVLVFMKNRARQQSFGFMNRGGKRRGAGRKRTAERPRVSHRARPKLSRHHPVLVTMRLRAGRPSLRCDAEHAIVRRALEESASESFQVVHYTAQSNHVHMLVEAKDARALSRGMNSLTVRLVRRLQKLWRRVIGRGAAGPVFDDRYHARILETPRAVRTAVCYVMQNGRKHRAWTARFADRYSSGDGFEGWSREERDPRAARSKTPWPRWVSRARTWLLSIGWRKHGLIDPREVPASA